MPGHDGTTLGYDAAGARPYSEEGTGSLAEYHFAQPGLTKRESFAKAALIGLLADPDRGSIEECAQGAVRAADALIAALNAKPQIGRGAAGPITTTPGDYDSDG